MSADWKPGDLALCVRGGFIAGNPMFECPISGRIYRVKASGEGYCCVGTVPTLWLEDGPPNSDGSFAWGATRFRKINPHTPDAEDRETIELLNRKPAEVDA